MSTTPAKGRSSAIPTPGRISSIPTSGRPRSASSIHHPSAGISPDDEYISRAFADAIKANDPAHHRAGRASDVSLSPPSPHFPSQPGRRSVAARPPSVASSSSAVSAAGRNNRPPPRPTSRTSDLFTRSSSRTERSFDVGDSVRVESLGFEGTLQYLGEIEGKAGLFAGVELSGGFAGKGKNDGSVNGKQYFTCPPSCGIFILANKLSAPTAGYGSTSRPSSVASTRNGRVTPSLSGRITPSFSSTTSNARKTPSRAFSNGPITPSASAGRRTPGTAVPMTRTRTITAIKKVITPAKPAPAESIITPGSRASKYIGMTAKQLSSRATGAVSPSRQSIGSPTLVFGLRSPTQSSSNLTSPSRNISSPFTPRAGRVQSIGVGIPSGTPTRVRPGPGTPRARLPSAVSMPPPPSPSASLSSRSVSLNDPVLKPGQISSSEVDLIANGRVIQDMIGGLMSGRPPSRPSSSASVTSSLVMEQQLQLQIERLQARLDALDDENRRLRASLTSAETSATAAASQLAAATGERDKSASRITELESSLRTIERTISERDSTIESLERSVQQSILDTEKAKSDGDARVRDVQSKLDDKDALVSQLKELIEAKEGMQSQNDAVLMAKNTEIGLLEARVQKAYAELEEERRELGGQVDELRKAGQETIALYEERLSAADAKRYEMEDLVASLEDQLRVQARPVSPATVARQAVSAVEIDNEALKEQVQHLQKKLASLEDSLEDAHLAAEREELAVRERVLRYKEREDCVRKELAESQQEVERISKLEESARLRTEEIEEALRENTVALENARAEIEVLRAEVADLESVATAAGGPSKTSNKPAGPVTGDFELLKAEKTELERVHKEREVELAEIRDSNAELRQSLEERTAELDTLRKRLNRDIPINGLQDRGVSPSPSKDIAAVREEIKSHKEEIKGHKHIIQELQKELTQENQRNKVLESENKLLVSEIAQLREDMRKLEDTFEQTLTREEQELAAEAPNDSPLGDAASLQKTLRELKTKYESELDQLRRNMSEAEMRNARAVHDLHKEIGELESLIETKIYREDELESEIERLKERLARSQKKSSKTGLPEDSRSSLASTATLVSSPSTSSQPFPSRSNKFSDELSPNGSPREEVCEICERPGHDIFTCDLLKDDRPLSSASMISSNASHDLFCEDCEEPGHIAANCPHSMDVF